MKSFHKQEKKKQYMSFGRIIAIVKRVWHSKWKTAAFDTITQKKIIKREIKKKKFHCAIHNDIF